MFYSSPPFNEAFNNEEVLIPYNEINSTVFSFFNLVIYSWELRVFTSLFGILCFMYYVNKHDIKCNIFFVPGSKMEECLCCGNAPKILFKLNGRKIQENTYIIIFLKEICGYTGNFSDKDSICRQCLLKLENFYIFSNMLKRNILKIDQGKHLLSPEQKATCTPEGKEKAVKKKRKLEFSPNKNSVMSDHGYSSKIVAGKFILKIVISSSLNKYLL